MTETGAKTRRGRLWKYLAITTVVSALALAGLAWYATSEAFQIRVHRLVVSELESITGGRVDLGGFHTSPFRLRVDVEDLTIHGRETATEIPYIHVARVIAQIRIISLLQTRFGFSSLVLDHPVVHIIVYPDGATNQPRPELAPAPGKNALQQLFALSISRFEARHGELIWADQKIPFNFIASDVAADMTYSLLRRRFYGNLLLGKIDTTFNGYRPFAWTAEAHFNLGRDNVEITSLQATSGRSLLRSSVRIRDFQHPRIDADYEIKLDLLEAETIARHHEVRRGILQAKGRGSWLAGDFSSDGKIFLKDFEYRDRSVGLRTSDFNSQFSLDPQRVALSQIQANFLSGSVSGDAEITQWLGSAPPGKGKPGERRGTVHLRMKDLSAAEIASALATEARPFHRIHMAAAVSGSIDARWKRSLDNTEAEILLDAVPPAHPTAAQFPLRAHFRGAYRAALDEIEVKELNAATRATQLQASGTLSSRATLKLTVNTTDLGEWQPVLAAAGYKGNIPVALHGRASFLGTATGKLSSIAFAGSLQSQSFDLLVPASSQTQENHVHWDSLSTDIRLSPHNFAARNGTLHQGNASITFDLTASLQERRLTDASLFNARVNVHNAEAAEVLALAGYSYPISGRVDLSLQGGGTLAEPGGEGRLQLTDALIYGEPVERLNSAMRFSKGEAAFNNIQMKYFEARVTGDGTYNLSTRAFRFSFTGANFDLARIPKLQTSRVAVEGRMDFTAVGSGTPENPTVNAAIRLRALTLDHERAGDLTIDAVTEGRDVRLTGRSQFENAELDIDGKIKLNDDWPSSFALRFNHLDVDALLRTYLKGRLTGHSASFGEVQLEGPLLKPRDLRISGNLSDFSADVENFKMRSRGPIRFSVSSQVVSIQQLRLIGEGTDLSASGTVQLNGERKVDLRAQGSANLKLIETFNPAFSSSGMVTVDVTVAGTVARPLTQGRVQIASGFVGYSDLPSALSDINGSLIFSRDRLQIESLTAHTGGGLVTLGGYATSYNGAFNFDITVQGQDVRLRYPQGISSTATANLHFAGTTAASTLSGDITVNRLAMTPGFDFGAYLARSAQTTALPQTNPLLNQIRLDIHIVTAPELQMQTATVRLSGDADLRLRGTAAKPVLLGRADVIEGEVYFNWTKYRLERGDVTFTNPVSTDPVLDLQASTHIRDYDITLILNGKVDKLNITYRSEPPLPTADIIALLALGRTREESAQLQQSSGSPFSQEASSAILNAAINATVSNRMQHLFGVSHIKIDPQGLNTETSPTQTGPAVTIEQQVANNLTLTYTTSVSQTSQQIIQVEYNITRNVSIVGLRDQNGVVSFDVRVRQRKK